jgi:P450-derived glycosyltransferase activator
MIERGMQWLYAHGGDPYAVLLRAEGVDRNALVGQIHELGPLYRSRTEAWVTGDRVLGREVLADPRLVSRVPGGLSEGHVLRQCEALPDLSAVEHDRLRERPELNLSAGVVERICDEALGRIDGAFDLTADVLRPVLAGSASELLAVPSVERDTFSSWCQSAGGALDAALCPPKLAHARVLMNAVGHLRSLVGRVAGPDEDRFAAGMLVSVVGVEVAANVVANSMLALLDQPGQWRLLCEDPGLAEAAVEETLRYDPPVRLDSRGAREDLTLAGQQVDAGSEVVVCIDAANRYPGLHRSSDGFDVRRASAADHLSLSGRPHLDLVAPLVRTSTVVVLRLLATRLPQIRRTGSVVHRLRAPVTHSIVRFPVTACARSHEELVTYREGFPQCES